MEAYKTDPHGYALRFLESWNKHETKKALQWMTNNCVWEFTVGSDPKGTRYEGLPAIGQAFEAIVKTVPNLHYDLIDYYVGENHLIMEILVTGSNSETGATLRYQACDILLFEGEKVKAKRSYRKVVS